MNTTWDILIPTLGQRVDRFTNLATKILNQTWPYGGGVRVIALYNNGERSLGEIRQALVRSSNASYVSFVDDDDDVPPYFVDEVMKAIYHPNWLDAPVDYVGWQMQCYVDGAALKPTYHSLRYAGWSDDSVGYYRDVSHLNPTLREHALRADFRRGEPPEDVSWADQVRGSLITESYVDKVMYYYHSSTADSTWRGNVTPGSYERFDLRHPYFSYHPLSSR